MLNIPYPNAPTPALYYMYDPEMTEFDPPCSGQMEVMLRITVQRTMTVFHAFNLLSSHAGQYGSMPPGRIKYLPSVKRPLHS
jgi:hypothetical protein